MNMYPGPVVTILIIGGDTYVRVRGIIEWLESLLALDNISPKLAGLIELQIAAFNEMIEIGEDSL